MFSDKTFNCLWECLCGQLHLSLSLFSLFPSYGVFACYRATPVIVSLSERSTEPN